MTLPSSCELATLTDGDDDALVDLATGAPGDDGGANDAGALWLFGPGGEASRQGHGKDAVPSLDSSIMGAPLSSNLDDETATPYFLWDDPMTVAEFRRRLRDSSPPERFRLLGRLLREARDTDVWRFTTLEEVVHEWPSLVHHLGRRRSFWEFLLEEWRVQGLLP
jgi:hypothetical protein